ncbi:MAG: hypothetical protein WCG78_03910 [Candidatus Omnitrophota bacterium]
MKRLVFLSIGVMLILRAGTACALEFSADMVCASREGNFSGKICVAENKVRSEMMGMVSIVRLDKKVTWVMMPGQKMYMEQPISPMMVAGASEKMPGEIERKFLGNETIDGRNAAKYRIEAETGGVQQAILQWSDTATSVPLKVSAEDGSWSVEYKNLKVGPQDAAVFELPEGYSKFAMPDMNGVASMFGGK